MSVLLSALAESSTAALRILLVEEPEAHLHPQLQDLLMRYLENQGSAGTQVVVTSHSPNFAASARVERATVLTRGDASNRILARSPAEFSLASQQLAHLRRFLDVTKSSLLFARGVILVEGVAEQLLVPAIASLLGRPLAPSGVAVVNIGGVAFAPFIALFGPDRLPYRCAAITDGDPSTDDPDDEADHDAHAPSLNSRELTPSPRAQRLEENASANVRVCIADRTLEWDLAKQGNWEVLLAALERVRPRVARWLRTELETADNETRADALLSKLRQEKGEFAQHLADLLVDLAENLEPTSPGLDPFAVPPYLRAAIEWVTPDQPPASTGDERSDA